MKSNDVFRYPGLVRALVIAKRAAAIEKKCGSREGHRACINIINSIKGEIQKGICKCQQV